MKCVPRLNYSVIPRSSVEFLAIGIVCFFESPLSRCRRRRSFGVRFAMLFWVGQAFSHIALQAAIFNQ